MYTRSVQYYDAIYGFKDYEATARRLVETVESRHPSAATLLDVACGTGKHVELLKAHYRVEGLDYNEGFLDIARRRCPNVRFHQGDMVDFALDGRFDVITCLFSSIAYARTADRMFSAVASMSHHLAPGGLLIIEPFFTPEQYWTGTVTANFVDQKDLKIAWMYTSNSDGVLTVLDIHYLIGTPAGVEHFVERHELGLFTDSEYREAFAAAGLEVEYDREGLFGRGMFLGRRRADLPVAER